MLEPVSRSNIAETVYNTMLSMIADNTWKEGEKIPSENELKDQFQVSRNTVRQAIHKLSALGIVEAKQGEGTFVKKIDTGFYINILIPSAFINNTSDCMKILEFEKSIQVESVKVATKRATDEEIEGLHGYLEQMKTAKDEASFFDADIEYHIYLSKVTHNEMFYKSMCIIRNLLRSGLLGVVMKYGSGTSIEAHTRVYGFMKTRKAEEAAQEMDRHMGDIVDKLYTVLNEK